VTDPGVPSRSILANGDLGGARPFRLRSISREMGAGLGEGLPPANAKPTSTSRGRAARADGLYESTGREARPRALARPLRGSGKRRVDPARPCAAGPEFVPEVGNREAPR
jgi:hypothetical protein